MRVLVTLINFQLAEHVRAELRFRQHAFDRVFNDPFRLTRNALLELFGTQSAGISRVAVIDLLLGFHAGHLHLFGVDHYNMIAGIKKRRVLGALFAHQDARDLRRQTAQRFAGRVHHIPLTRNFPRFGEIR